MVRVKSSTVPPCLRVRSRSVAKPSASFTSMSSTHVPDSGPVAIPTPHTAKSPVYHSRITSISVVARSGHSVKAGVPVSARRGNTRNPSREQAYAAAPGVAEANRE